MGTSFMALDTEKIIDKNGKHKAVVLDIRQYKKLLSLIEETKIIKMINKGEREYGMAKIKPISSLAELE